MHRYETEQIVIIIGHRLCRKYNRVRPCPIYPGLLVIVALIIIAFLYSDFQDSHKPGQKHLKKNIAIAVFVAVTLYSMITGRWIFWAGITAILYVDALVDSIKEWLDARNLVCLYALKLMQSPGSDYSGALQSIQESILRLKKLVNDLDQGKSE